MDDKFLGRWLVTEYVFNPDGRYAGSVKQKRDLHELANGRIRVTQQCQPDSDLAQHPLARFAGEWQFELSRDGRVRHYHGPAVIGTGVTLCDGVMTGSGVWPTLGFTFRSYGILPHPQRQLTGGQFFLPGETVANIIGVAEPEEISGAYPQLSLDFSRPKETIDGSRQRFAADGRELEKGSFTRLPLATRNGFGWRENKAPHFEVIYREQADGKNNNVWGCESGRLQGFARRFGPAVMADLHGPDGTRLAIFEVHDAKFNQTVGLHHWYRHEQLQTVDFIQLGIKD